MVKSTYSELNVITTFCLSNIKEAITIPVPTFTGLPPRAEFNDVVAKINRLVQEMTNLLLGLDTLNIVSLNAEVIEAGSITGDKIAAHTITAEEIAADTITANEIAANAITTDEIDAGAVETDKLAAGAVTADKITVAELSAITANLGHITAGLIEAVTIYGALIATANGTYPRIELSNTANLLTAFKSLTNFLKIDADATDPGIFMDNGVISSAIFNLTAFGSTFGLTTTGDILLRSDANVGAQSVNGMIMDIVDAINSKAPAFTGYTGTMLPGQTATIANGLVISVT